MLSDVLATGKPYRADEQKASLWRNGRLETVYLNFVYHPLREADGTISGVTVVANEITQQRIQRQQLERLNDSLQVAVDLAELGLWTWDVETDVVVFDERASDWYGYEAGWGINQVMNCTHPDDRAITETVVQQALHASGAERIEISPRIINPKTGVERLIRVIISRDVNAQGQATQLRGISQDVTQQERNRRKQAASEAKLRDIIAAAPAGIGLFVGRDLIIETPNQTFIDIVGKGPDIVGLPLREAMPELLAEGQPFLKILDDVFTTGVPFITSASLVKIVQQGVLNDNYYNISYTPLRNAAGEIYAILDIAIDVTEQVKIQQALAESEARFRTMAEASDLMIVVADETGVPTYYNAAWERFSGRTAGELLVNGWDDLGHPDDLRWYAPLYTDKVAQGEGFTSEIRVTNYRGEYRWLYTQASVRRHPDGTMAGFISTCIDITDRKLVELDNRLKTTVLDNSPLIIGIGPFDGVGEFAGVPSYNNVYTLERLGWPTNQGKTMVDAVYPEDRAKAARLLPEMIANGGGVAEIRLWNEQTGRPFWVDWTVFVINDPKTGQPMALATVSPDITERRQNQRVLEEKEAALRNTIELAELGTFNVDMVANTITVSPRVANWFGFDELTASADSFIDCVGEADRDLVRASLHNTLLPESKGRYNVIHSVVHAKTGRQVIIHALGQLYIDATGQPLRVEGTAQDITNQRKLQLVLENQVQQRTEELAASNEELASMNEELTASNEEYAVINEELEEANGLLSRSNDNLQTFAYIASHDLQEPLRKIQQFGDLLKTRLPASVGDDELVYLERMQVAASRMSGLIKDLLSFSRISTQRSVEKPVSLQAVVGEVLDLLELTIVDSKANIQVDTLPIVSGDAVQLNQLFQNLISNALKFQRVGADGALIPPQIRISAQLLTADALPPTIKPARRAPAYHCIEVADNGIGFDEKYLTRIFQVFQRLHSKSQYAGTGVGLAICEKVVANHGGVITASSQPGQGATFIIYLHAD